MRRRRQRERLLGLLALGTVVALSVLVIVIRPGQHKTKQVAEAPAIVSTTTMTQSSTTATTAAVSTAAPPTSNSTSTEPAFTVNDADKDALRQRVVGFETNYFARNGMQTAGERHALLEPFATEEFLAKLDQYSQPTDPNLMSNADLALARGLVVTTAVKPDDAKGELVAEDRAIITTDVPITTKKGDAEITHVLVQHITYWMKIQGEWRVYAHNPPGNS